LLLYITVQSQRIVYTIAIIAQQLLTHYSRDDILVVHLSEFKATYT